MATILTPKCSLISLLHRSYPHVVPSESTDVDLESVTSKLFPASSYSDAEQQEISRWLPLMQNPTSHSGSSVELASEDNLKALNTHLATRTTMLGAKPSVLDIVVYATLAPLVESWSAEQRTGPEGLHHIVRHVDFVQNAALFALQVPNEEKVKVDADNVIAVPEAVKQVKKEEKKGGKKEKGRVGESTVVVGRNKKDTENNSNDTVGAEAAGAAGAAAGKKKEKTPRQKKQAPPAAQAAPLSPSLVDLRVGHILRAVNHPNADSLYVSTIACGDAPGTDNTHQDEETGQIVRTVCSGLNGLVPLPDMQGRKVVAVCNLKPVTMRGVKSAAMVLAASKRSTGEADEDKHGGPVELVNVPDSAQAGERVYFEGWEDGQAEKVLNPKKKIWETVQPGFTTTEALEVAFEKTAVPQLGEKADNGVERPAVGKLVVQSGGVCTVQTLKGAVVR